MDIVRALRNVFTGERRSRPPTQTATLNLAHEVFGSWRAVATALGISERTLRRVRAGLVSPRSAARIGQLAAAPAVRAAAVRPRAARRNTAMQANGARVVVSGSHGPAGYGEGDYKRTRTIDFILPPEAVTDIQNAFFAGDDRGAEQAFGYAVRDYYGNDTTRRSNPAGWDFGDVGIDFDPA